MVRYRSPFVLLCAFVAALIAVVLGFRWLGTDGRDWPGWLALAVLLLILDSLIAAFETFRHR